MSHRNIFATANYSMLKYKQDRFGIFIFNTWTSVTSTEREGKIMRHFKMIIAISRRALIVTLALLFVSSLSETCFAKGGGGGGHGEGSSNGEFESQGGGRHGGEGIESHGADRHGGESVESHGGQHGSIVRDMPSGYIEISHRGNRHFFYEGRFFDRHRDGFIVIGAPIGIRVPSLPGSAVSMNVGGVTIFAAEDNYFRRIPDGFVTVESPFR
jgi:hypothetical protein